MIGNTEQFLEKYLIEQIQLFSLNKIVTIIEDKDPDRIANELYNANLYVQLEKLFNNIEGGVSTKSSLIMSAMHAGLPIISTIGDMTDSLFFKDKINLFLISQNSNRFLCDTIKYILENPENSKNIAYDAKNTYHEYASWKTHINLLNIYL